MIIQSAKEFGALVRSERKRRGWNQKELASRVGVSPLWISQIERGKPTAHIGLVLRTLRTLGVKLSVGDPAEAATRAKATLVNLDELVQRDADSMLLSPEEFERLIGE